MPRKNPMAVLLAAAILDLIGFAILLPILPLYAEKLGATKWEMMAIMGAYSAIQFVAAPTIGRLSDRYGRRPLLIICYAGSALAYAVFAVAHSLPLMAVSRLIGGVTGGNIPLAQAVVSDTMPPERRTRGMGLIGMAMGIGFIVGPASGALAYRFLGPAAPAILAAALSGTSTLIAWLFLPETAGQRDPGIVRRRLSTSLIREAFHYPPTGMILAIALVAGMAFATFESTFSQFLQGRYRFGPGDVGPIFALIGIVLAVVQGGLIGPLARGLGEARLIGLGTLTVAVSLAAIPLMPGLGALLPLLALYAVGSGVLSPAMSSLVPASCPPQRVGAMLGVFQAMSSLGRILGPIWGQYAHGTFGEAFPYYSAAILMGAACALAVRGVMFRRRPARAAA